MRGGAQALRLEDVDDVRGIRVVDRLVCRFLGGFRLVGGLWLVGNELRRTDGRRLDDVRLARGSLVVIGRCER